MKNLNFIILEGNLVKDPEYKETDSGMPRCRFILANNYSFKKDGSWNKDVNYFNIVTWSRTAETCNHYLKKGNPVRVKGRLDQKYKKMEDGKSVNFLDIVAQSVDFLPRPKRVSDTNVEVVEAA